MSRATVLVLEDDVNLLNGIRDILEIQGYNVLIACDGAEGLKIMRGNPCPPDLIVSDIMMPNMDGYAFLENVRQDDNWMSIPFIFLTAKGEKTDVRFGKMLGADDYLIKPFEAEDLVVVVGAKLRRRRQIDQVQISKISDIKHRILTILHHEFRTPLTYVVAYSDMLNRDIDELSGAEMRDFLKGVNSGADRLRRLIENFILLVELETGEAANTFNWRKREITDWAPILNQAVAIKQCLADERGVRLQVEPIPHSLPVIVGDAEYLKAALSRLIENGIKFSDKPNAVVSVSVSANGNHLFLQVADQGRGIAANEMEAIFEVFYQIDRQIHEDQGAGTGLSIVKRIAELHGGSVEANSRVSKGSEFIIVLTCDPA